MDEVSYPGAPPPWPFVQVPGSPRIAFSACGSGELVLFLHGIGGNRSNWYRQLTAVGAFARAASWDARGYGASDDYDGDVTIADFAHDVRRLIDHCGAARVHLVGLSLGGRIAQRFALLYPQRVASLTLVDTRPDTRDTRSPDERAAFLAARAEPLLAGRTPADIAPAVARGLAGPDIADAAMQELVASISMLRAGSYLKTIKANLDDDFAGDLSSISAPTLVMVGEHDTLTPLPLAQELAACIPGAVLRVVPGAGHLSNIENASAFNACLGAFLKPLL
ncbi:alpha/beta fold hydrolase [Paraburkholderia caballeronis]|uniref:3-oxoadipate enol-lactonase n=1 Tax=Paraburkholderia caballeronis TaxID=416943 RepID=A0A1H7M051_9BURK|nr:alpha/beta fold hydrolase [Paraburkholderia caballeronis]PXW28650.1 3-oxoadipate enol-lactonase [Paraburkholderia caballeronis]PXX04016.1 3-oxoadipate enol-lactonase [Paraburkholderia caballeronis]RAK04760.1 3-oxoadipate enol-lactonase [Paraburkholderia caballeronis]SED66283.1 3-oxoadipate enol-lactonase [Paraburkholderia caballeronis]SEL03947.1 3-oxoadipate enol-lactonase [Paraburkholderia caballeronis]